MMDLLKSLIKGFEERTDIEFTGELKINGRLSKSLGRCKAIIARDLRTGKTTKVNPVGIDISKKFLEIATPEEIVSVLAHEFAHYCTYKTYGDHDHSTKEFKMFCNILETNHAPSMSTKNKIRNKYDVFCSCCGEHIGVKSTARAGVIQNPSRYTSRCCKAPVRIQKNF